MIAVIYLEHTSIESFSECQRKPLQNIVSIQMWILAVLSVLLLVYRNNREVYIWAACWMFRDLLGWAIAEKSSSS